MRCNSVAGYFLKISEANFANRSKTMKTLMTSLLVAAGMLLGSTAQADDTATAASASPPAVEKDATASVPPPVLEAPKAKPTKALKLRPGAPRPRDMDLRHCLELPTNAEIAACAGE